MASANITLQTAWRLLQRVPTVVPACILFNVGLILEQVLSGAGIYIPGQLGFWFPSLILVGFFAAICFSLYRCIFGRSHGLFPRFGPAIFQIITVALVFFTGIEGRVTRWNFEARLARRMEVVRMVERGTIQGAERGPCDCFYAELPVDYKSVSAGHVILISHHSEGISITFYVHRWGMFDLDDYTAFIYRSGNGQPQTDVEDTATFHEIQKWENHWFFVVHG